MRVLWLSGASLDFVSNRNKVFRCGWYQSLMEKLYGRDDIILATAFDGRGEWGRKEGNIITYPISVFEHRRNKIKRQLFPGYEEKLLLPEIRRVIAEFQPDVIHIWGTEFAYGLICRETDIPCIIHVQGILNPYANAGLPPGINQRDVLLHLLRFPRELESYLRLERVRRYREEREQRIFKGCSNYFGRTQWDHAVTRIYHPDSRYFYCSELLRKPFYEKQGLWRTHDRKKKKIVSVISMPYYKGHDLILKTAKLLAQSDDFDFSWEVYGVYSMKFWEAKLNIQHEQVHVALRGFAGTEDLANALLDADLYVHPSYIDNSPNGLCEAQMLGLPVMACYTGGVPSLIQQDESGILVPCNDPWQTAYFIRELLNNREHASRLGRRAAETAARRHDPETIVNDLLTTYRSLSGK